MTSVFEHYNVQLAAMSRAAVPGNGIACLSLDWTTVLVTYLLMFAVLRSDRCLDT